MWILPETPLAAIFDDKSGKQHLRPGGDGD